MQVRHIPVEVMPFGLMNALATFRRKIDRFFQGMEFARLCHDDIFIHSKSVVDHLVHIDAMF